MKTPCVKVCQMDPRLGVCLGCKRTLDEIARWGGMSDQERERVMAELPRRTSTPCRAESCAADPKYP